MALWRLGMVVVLILASCSTSNSGSDPDPSGGGFPDARTAGPGPDAGSGGPSTDAGSSSGCDDPETCVYEAGCPPILDPSSLPSCAADAHCLARSLIEAAAPELAGELAPCTDAAQLCVPDVFLMTGGAYLPATCTSINANEGRCLSMALPQIGMQASYLPQANCTAHERCAPCFDPVTGMSTGACSTPCDPGPSMPAMPFPACCEGRARCVPAATVDPMQAENLEEHECGDLTGGPYLCVPDELIRGDTPPACNAESWILGDYNGVCLSDCLDFGFEGIALEQGNCAGGYTCAPCIDPTSGQPTGAPGCPSAP